MTDEAFPSITDASADDASPRSALEARFPRPWTVEHRFESFAVFDAHHRPLAYFYFQIELNRLYPPNYLGREEARHLATSFANFGDSGSWAGSQPKRIIEAQFPPALCKIKANE